jgi:hypothetical protein
MKLTPPTCEITSGRHTRSTNRCPTATARESCARFSSGLSGSDTTWRTASTIPPNNPKSKSGSSGLLGTGARGDAAGKQGAADADGRHTGVALPSNLVEVKSESSQGTDSAPFPRALVEFFLLAFTDAGDVVFDPFMGSGTTMAAAALLDRRASWCEISPGYCDVILRRIMNLTGETPMLAKTGETFAAVAEARGVPVDQALNPKQNDSRAIKHNGPNPHYGPRKRKAS